MLKYIVRYSRIRLQSRHHRENKEATYHYQDVLYMGFPSVILDIYYVLIIKEKSNNVTLTR